MTHNDLPERWKSEIQAHLASIGKPTQSRLSASEFDRNHVKIDFPDGSTAFFKYAFFIKAPKWNEVAVFTEHCGYHLFPLTDLKISVIE